MSSKANVNVTGTLDGEKLDLWIYTHIGESTVEADIAEGLSRVDPDKQQDPSSVFSHIFAAMSRGSGNSLYVTTQHASSAYRTVKVDCRDHSVHVTSIYEEDPERHYSLFEQFIDYVRFRNFHPTPGARVRVAQLLGGRGLQGVYDRYLNAREMDAQGVIIGLAAEEEGVVWLVDHSDNSTAVGAYIIEELMPF